MKPVLTPRQAVELDRDAQAEGVTAADLMERAGRAVARAAAEVSGGVYGRRAVVVCGKGNNGGDGFVAGRHLARAGMRVDVVGMDDAGPSGGGGTATNRARLAEAGVAVRPWDGSAARVLDRADVVVDAMFGTGFRGKPDGVWGEAIDAINAGRAPVVAVDIASGVDGATGLVEERAVWARLTVAFGAAKVGSVLLPGAERSGTVRVVDIGFPPDLLRPTIGLTEPADVAAALPTRAVGGHKRSSGVLLVVAGSRRMTGAPALIARAAGRMGAGLVIVGVPLDAVSALQASTTEAVFLPLPQTDEGTVAFEALEPLLEAAQDADCVALGPGLSRNDETARVVRELALSSPTPLVIDADGLNAFEGRVEVLRRREAETVLTPHDGEYRRLTERSVEDVSDRIAASRTLAEASGAVSLLKGTRTVIAPPRGLVRVNPTGTSALATAGTGDVLTGMIAALVARGVQAVDAATAATYLHGGAGRSAARELGEATLARDVIERIPAAVAEVLG